MTKQTSCSVEGCESKILARGWCSKHWQRWKKYGDPKIVKTKRIYFDGCASEGCENQGKIVRGYCTAHYQRLMKYGDVSKVKKSGPRQGVPDLERFMERVQEGSNGCWLWDGYINRGGYGTFPFEGKSKLAHRVGYILLRGELPDGVYLDHRAECPRHCVNPEHVRIATPKENSENHKGLPHRKSKSGVRNVHWNSAEGNWKVAVISEGVSYHGGYFKVDDLDSAREAAKTLRNRLFKCNDIDR